MRGKVRRSRMVCAAVALIGAMAVLFVESPVRAQDAATDPAPTIRFNFQGATFQQVVDFFARSTGMPVVWESDPPEGTLNYISPESYPTAEALHVLNIILQSRGVMLRVDDGMLYLQKLEEMKREDLPTFTGRIPDDVPDDQIVTVVRPLTIALAKPMAERLADLVASYGSVTAMEAQNTLVITETAGQIRRLSAIIETLDLEDPEGVIEIIPIKHADAQALMEPLSALLAQKVEKYVVNQKGQQQKIEEETMAGLNITADPRTNSIIAKGTQSRIDQLHDALRLLDVPESAGGRAVRTFALERLDPNAAKTTLETLFSKVEEGKRPTILPLPESGRITLVGATSLLEEATQVLREVDGGSGDATSLADGDTTISVIAIEHAEPSAIVSALQQLLTRRQQAMVKLLSGPDGHTLIVSGPARDVASVEAIVPRIDARGPVDRELRIVRLATDDPAGLLRRTRELFDRQLEANDEVDDPAMMLDLDLDEESRSLRLLGSRRAIDRYLSAMRELEQSTVVATETRTIDVQFATPSRLVSSLDSVARSVLDPRDGTTFTAPTFEPVDALDALIVTAPSEQFTVIESLVATLDRPTPADYQFRVIPLANVADVDALRTRASQAYTRMAAAFDADELGELDIEHDTLTGNVIVSGRAQAVQMYEQAMNEARRLQPPARTGRLLTVREARASDIVEPLRDLATRMEEGDTARQIPPPELEAVESTNSIYVVAEPAQHTVIERALRELDRFEPTELPPLKLIQVRAADVNQLAAMLRQRYDKRPPEQRREKPVTIDADLATGTLIVTAHPDVYTEIREFVDSINVASREQSQRETMLFPLKRARAADLASALEKLYPEPPMPVDRRGNPMPHLREPKEVYVSADAATNTLIVEAPSERRASFDALVEQLDRVELPPTAQLRTYHVDRGDPAQIARTLTELARRGVLSHQPEDGSKAVDVLVQPEPISKTLIVAGDQVTFEKTEEILIDLQVVPVQRELRVFEFRGADLADIAAQAQRLYVEQTLEIPDAGEVSVEVDAEAGALLVVAESEAMIRFAAILNQLEVTIGPPPDVRLVPLQYADATEVVGWLRDLIESHAALGGRTPGRPMTFEAIERTNSIFVAAPTELHPLIASLIDGFDSDQRSDMPPLRILQLRTADARNLATALMREYDQRPMEDKRAKPARITADTETNSIIVAAHPDLMPEIQSIVTELNATTRYDDEDREIRIFPLKVARAEELAETIDQMYPEPPMPVDRRGNPMPHLREPREVVVRADKQTNSIIVDAPGQRMAGFEQLVEQLDRAQIVEETEIRTYDVVYADLDAVASTLRQLAQSGTLMPQGRDRRVPVSITTEPASEALIVSGPVEAFERVEQVLAELDVRRAGPTTTLRFFHLDNARAETLADMLRQVLTTRMAEELPEVAGRTESLLNVTADRKTNTLIVDGPESMMPLAEELIRQLDASSAAIGEPTVRVRPLTFAAAADVAQALTQALPTMVSRTTGEPVDVRLVPAPGSNAVILVGLESDLTEVEALIEPLDARPALDAVDAKTFALKYADAPAIASIVQNLLTDQLANDPRFILEQIRRSRGEVKLEPRIRVEAEARTNRLIVSGPQQTVALAESLIEELDRPDVAGERTYAAFTPVRADVNQLAEATRRVLEAMRPGGRRTSVELVPEVASRTVLVMGPQSEVDEAVRIMAERDEHTPAAPQTDLRIVSVEHMAAAPLAQSVTAMLRDRSRWPDALRAAADAGLPVGEPVVTADAAANRLLVSAPQELLPVAIALIGELDQARSGAASVDVRVIALRQAQAPDVAQAMQTAAQAHAQQNPGRPAPVVSAEPTSNSVVIAAAPQDLELLESIAAELDQGFSPDSAQVRTVFLEHASAEAVAPIVEQLLAGEQLDFFMRFEMARRQFPFDSGPDVRVAADARLNAVVVAAPPTVLDVAEEMIAQLDVAPGAAGTRQRSVRVLAVENADASELAASLEAIFADEAATEAAPVIRVDRTSNTLLVRATDAQFATIAEVAEAVDDATIATARQMRLVPIDPSRASAADVAATLERLLDRSGGSTVEVVPLEELIQRQGGRASPPAGAGSSALPRGAPGLPLIDPTAVVIMALATVTQEDDLADVTIAVDPASNSLVVIGSPRAVERISALAAEIQAQFPAEPGRVRIVPLPDDADARGLATLVDQALRRLTPAGGQPGDLRARASVIADASTNALVITANDRDFDTISGIVVGLAQAPAGDERVVKIYPLTTVTADRAEASVRDLLGGSDPRSRRNRQAERMRSVAVTLMSGDDEAASAVLSPERIRVSADAQSNALLVMAPPESIAFLDRYIELIDQAPVNVQATLKLYPMRQARADDVVQSLRTIFRSRFRSMQRTPGVTVIEPEFAADERTNTLIATAAPEQLVEVDALLEQLDVQTGEDVHPMRVVELQAAQPSGVAEILDKIVVGSDQARRAATQIIPDDNSGVLLVRASEELNAEIDAVLAEIDREPAGAFPVRTIVLERANAEAVAQALQRFFDDRAQMATTGRGRRQQGRRVSIIGDANSRTLLVAASEENFAIVEDLVSRFDSPESTSQWSFRVFELKHAKAADIEDTLNELISDLTWGQGPIFFSGRFNSRQNEHGTLAVRADERLNAIIATGEGNKFDIVDQLITVLDVPPDAGAQRIVKVYHLDQGDLSVMSDVIEDAMGNATNDQPWWWGVETSGQDVTVRIDQSARALIVSATPAEHELVSALVTSLSDEMGGYERTTTVVPVRYADAQDLERSLSEFLQTRDRQQGIRRGSSVVVAARTANAIIVSADPATHATVRDLITQLDREDVAGDRRIEIIALEVGDAGEIADIIRDQFDTRGGREDGLIVTADLRSNAIILNAPEHLFVQAQSLVAQLDKHSASDATIIRTYALESAQADDVVDVLTQTLQLDRSGETEGFTIRLDPEGDAVEVKGRIVADGRSNSLVVTATEVSLPVIEHLIHALDETPAVNPTEFRIIPLQHAIADEVSFTLGRIGSWTGNGPTPEFDYNRKENTLIVSATADQFEQITRLIGELDQPSERARRTDFVPLQFAKAEQVADALEVFYGPFAVEADTPGKLNTRIVPDPATNSLVITAEESEWEDIRALLAKLDSPEYDASLQLQVIPLIYADASSVSDAINEAFAGQIERKQRGQQPPDRAAPPGEGGDRDRRDAQGPGVLIESEEWVRASAEPQTNSVIVSANRQNIAKIQAIITQLDVADFAKLPPPRLIRVRAGDPVQLAESLNALYEQGGRNRGRTGLRIVGDIASSTVIVRASAEDFQQIQSLAEALQVEAAQGGVQVRVLTLQSAPARRVAQAISSVYQAKAEQTGQALSIEVDSGLNALVVASTVGLFEEIEATVEQLDALAPAAGQGIFIIELEHIDPERAKSLIETIGLDEDIDFEKPSASRLVSEPVRVAVLEGRRAIVVIANPNDRDTVVDLVKAFDAEPALAEAQMRVVTLRNADAPALVDILSQVLTPGAQQVDTPLAKAIQEQVRRLAVRRNGLDEPDLRLDLTEPIRLIANESNNTVIVSSTPNNVGAVEELLRLFDQLPVTDAVIVQLFPLSNISANDFSRIVTDMFQQGKQLGRVPGTDRDAMPAGIAGRALLDDIAMSVDERTNTVVVAGKEDAVAFVEVLSQRLDSEIAVGWLEPRVLPLRYADADEIAETLNAILVEGQTESPQASPLQRQVARLRVARMRENGGSVLESEVFQPMTRLVIRPESQLNALVLVGTPVNLEVVSELVTMLDVEAASPEASVRIYPVVHASAARLTEIVRRLFQDQVQAGMLREEDNVIVQADERTNALIVTTSPRSFSVLEALLDMLDAEVAPDLREIRRIQLLHASAVRLEPLLQSLMDARLERLRRIAPESAELERAVIKAEARTNSLIIAAGNESYDVIKKVVDDLDTAMLADLALLEVVPLKQGNAERIADTINQVMERRYADLPNEVRQRQMPLVLTDPRSNSLLVAAGQEDMGSIQDLVFRLESVPADPAVGIHVVRVPAGASADTLAPRIERLMDDRNQSLGEARKPSDAVSVEVDPRSNTLIVTASNENLEIIESLVATIVNAESIYADRQVEVMPLASSRASDMVDMLQELYVDAANEALGQKAVRVTADDRANAVLVSGPGDDVEAIRALVIQLDGNRPGTVVEIKYVPLKSANALETVSLIENVLSGRGLGPRRASEQATVLKFVQEVADERGTTEMDVSSAIRETIALTPDVRTNTVIVRAPRGSMEMIERMIRELDSSSIGSKNVRIFKLQNADATATRAIIEDLFQLRQGNNLLVLKPREDVGLATGGGMGGVEGAAPGGGGSAFFGTELTAVPDERQQLSITVDSRTNSLLVSGTPRYLDLVEQVVEELDALEANEREVFVYELRNSDAAEVADIIGQFISQEQEKLVATLSSDQLGSAARLLEREVTITGDSRSNSVLVSASPRYIERVKEMIRQIDVDPPQVLIQVMLAEVTLESRDEWGVDLAVRGTRANTSIEGAFGFASTFVPGLGVPSLTIAATDFDLMIRAMRSQGRVQVLSNPAVMAANNEPAHIQIGEKLRLPESSSFTESGTTNTSLIEQDVGIILDVTPSINPDGYVRMLVTPTISALSEETTQVTESLESPIIEIREANTTVTVGDGQTVVIGGLIAERLEHREQKVPLLGDIPVLGALFRGDLTSTTRTELLIVLTPYVIYSPKSDPGERRDDMDVRGAEITEAMIKRITLPERVKDAIENNLLDFQGGLFDANGNPIKYEVDENGNLVVPEDAQGGAEPGTESEPQTASPASSSPQTEGG